MDPLSITASAIAVLGILTSTGKGINKLLALRKTPAQLQALSNEVEALRGLLLIVQTTLRRIHGTEVYLDNHEALVSLLGLIEGSVLDLQQRVEYQLKRSEERNKQGQPQVARIEWLKSSGLEIESLKQKIRDARDNLSIAIAALKLQTGENVRQMAVQIQYVEMNTAFDSSSIRQQQHLEKSRNELQQTVECLETNEIDRRSDSGSLVVISQDESLATQFEKLDIALRDQNAMGSCNILTESSAPNSSDYPSRVLERRTSICVRTTISTSQCLRFCKCRCHIQTSTQTPEWLRGVFAQLFCTYTSLLWTKPCNYPPCRASVRKSQFTYYFPAWLASRAVILSAALNDLSGPGTTLSLKVPIVVPRKEDRVWHSVRWGYLRDVQNRLALPQRISI